MFENSPHNAADPLPNPLPEYRERGQDIGSAARRKRAAFTLVELLVVIGIIGLLISILLPSLNAAREMARSTVCMSNLRQLALANQLYALDNHQYLVWAARDINSANLERWHGKRNNIGSAFKPERSDMARYFGSSGRLKECPSFAAAMNYDDNSTGAFEAGCGGYGYNELYLGGRYDSYYGVMHGLEAPLHTARTTDIRHPVETIMFTDAAYLGSDSRIAYSFCEPPFWLDDSGKPSASTSDPSIAFRHRHRTNVAWCDGHVDSRLMDFSNDYQTHSLVTSDQARSLGIGWFGPQSNEWFDLQ